MITEEEATRLQLERFTRREQLAGIIDEEVAKHWLVGRKMTISCLFMCLITITLLLSFVLSNSLIPQISSNASSVMNLLTGIFTNLYIFFDMFCDKVVKDITNRITSRYQDNERRQSSQLQGLSSQSPGLAGQRTSRSS